MLQSSKTKEHGARISWASLKLYSPHSVYIPINKKEKPFCVNSPGKV